MKTEIIEGQELIKKEVKWSRSMVVKSVIGELLILTNGIHKDDVFQGTVIATSATYSVGSHSKGWNKSNFTPITEPITIKFYPNE